MPRDTVDVYVQFAGGKDEYLADDSVPVSRPGELFGLHEPTVTSWNVGVNFHPTDVVAFGANYGRDTYGSLQLSRNANPPPDPTWTDPSRDWTLDNDDKINTFSVYLDLLRAVRNTDIRFGYDYSDSNNSFVHGGPRVAALTSLNQFIPLPDVENTWQRLHGRRPVLLHEPRRHRRRLLLREARHRRLQHDRHERPGRLRAGDRRSTHRLARRSDDRLR